MANQESTEVVPAGHVAANSGTGVVRSDAFPNPGLPPHRARVTDTSPKAAKHAEGAAMGAHHKMHRLPRGARSLPFG